SPHLANLHAFVQSSALLGLPSSHSSPTSLIPFPHLGKVQSFSQASPLVVLPSSHCSPWSTMPLPQCGSVHAFEQPSASIRLPSSHGSMWFGPWVSRSPSPHTLIWQCAVQSALSLLSEMPMLSTASHCSGPVAPGGVKLWLTLPSPHFGVVQSLLQVCDSGE